MSNYLPHTQEQVNEMLGVIGVDSVDALFEDIPENLRLHEPLPIPQGLSEFEVADRIGGLAEKNLRYKTIFRGAGAYRHLIPSVVTAMASRQEFFTAYTPYQAEISQGILQSIFEFETMICELTGMDASNASVYDGASAAGEAAAMCKDRGRNRFLVSGTSDPEVIGVVRTYCAGHGMELTTVPAKNGVTDPEALESMLDDSVAGVYVASPNYFGLLEDISELSALAHAKKAKFVAGCNPIALGMLKSPGECGADIACGEGQPLGLSLAFGGPYLGFLAARQAMSRKLPGRIVGQTTDLDGKRAFVLTLQAREQHIRREKAASNICSNQALCALTASIYLSALGPTGLREVASQCYAKAHYAFREITALPGFEAVYPGEFFHEFVTACPCDPGKLEAALTDKGILCGLPLEGGRILWCVTEANTREEIDTLVNLLREVRA